MDEKFEVKTKNKLKANELFLAQLKPNSNRFKSQSIHSQTLSKLH